MILIAARKICRKGGPGGRLFSFYSVSPKSGYRFWDKDTQNIKDLEHVPRIHSNSTCSKCLATLIHPAVFPPQSRHVEHGDVRGLLPPLMHAGRGMNKPKRLQL